MPVKPPSLLTRLLLAAWPLCQAQAQQLCDTTTFPASAPAERFQDNGDGTVTDRTNYLMWMRCSVGQSWVQDACSGHPAPADWASAERHVQEINQSGAYFFSDWRVPRLPELATLVERDCKDPRINMTVFPGTPAEVYWTTTSRPGVADEDRVYGLDFGNEGVAWLPKSEQHLVRLVRIGP